MRAATLALALLAAAAAPRGARAAVSTGKPLSPSPGTTTWASLPALYTVELAYPTPGAPLAAPPAPCNSTAPGSACLTALQAGSGAAVEVRYATSAPLNASSTASLVACFGAQSITGRPWRKANPVIAKDKSCSVVAVQGLPPAGVFVWKLGPDVPPAVYQVRVLELCAGGVYCATGTSPGYVQVTVAADRPAWLMGVMGASACVGPAALAVTWIAQARRKYK
jgi:hypothetical protein